MSTRLEASDSGRSVEVECIDDKHIIPAAVAQPRVFSGSVRNQFASLLTSHFLACTNPESGAALPRRPPNAPRFRGVTKHKRTQRYEAHIWECKKQIYLGGFDSEILAAKSHDIMAIRCKGANCEILNYELSDYEEMVPLVERLSREDIISALRNYSKAQTAIRIGSTASPSSGSRIQPFPMPSLPAIRAGGVQKPGGALNRGRTSGGVSTPRRPAGGPAAAGGMLQHQRRQRRRRRASLDISLSEEEDEDMDTEATEDVGMDAFGTGADSDGDYLNTPRSQNSHRYRGAHTSMLPAMPHSAPPVSRSRRHRSGQCPGAKVSPRISAAGSGGAVGGFRGGGSMMPGVSPFAWSAPSSPHTPDARLMSVAPAAHGEGVGGAGQVQITADEVAEYDDVDLNFVLSSLVDEPSLTYSANEESYLFESMPVDANHTALVHLGGVELFQQSVSVSEPNSPTERDSSSGDINAAAVNKAPANIITTGTGDYFPGTPLPTAASRGLGGAGAGSATPQTPASAGVVHQHAQLQIPPSMYHTSLPFTSPFAAAF